MADFEIKDAGVKCKGVFALRDYEKGEIIMRITGDIVETKDPNSLSKDFQDHCFPLGMKDKMFLYIEPTSPWMYVNHSCDANIGIKNDSEFVAMRNIKKGEELCFDYCTNNFDFDEAGWTMQCHCGSKNCRGIISTFDNLDKTTQKKLEPYLLSAVREKLKKE